MEDLRLEIRAIKEAVESLRLQVGPLAQEVASIRRLFDRGIGMGWTIAIFGAFVGWVLMQWDHVLNVIKGAPH